MEKPDNFTIVIFGASGDLTKRKLIPALFDSFVQGLLPKDFAILGVSRTEFSDEEFRKHLSEGIEKYSERKDIDKNKINEFIKTTYYQVIDTAIPEEYAKVKEKICKIDEDCKTENNYLFYLSIPPKLYSVVVESLNKQGLTEEKAKSGWRRVIVEKPFGYDLESAQKLNKSLLAILNESQIYRIDHYLGKETVQNMMVLRFANGIFEPLWNQKYIERIEITSSESIGVEDRGGYYDTSGALRDMVQNHMMQVLAMVSMEPPSVFEADSIRNETLKVFQSLKPIKKSEVKDQVIRGQYLTSHVRGKELQGYREEKGVDPNSKTETFVALKLFIDNWRWGGTPFYIRSGKGLPTKVTEVVVTFKATPHKLFKNMQSNQLIIRVQPDEGMLLNFGMKMPGNGFEVKDVGMDFHYKDLSDIYIPSAYERLLLDCMSGDATLYTRGDAVEACWKFVMPILNDWQDPESKVYGYPIGSWGPKEAETLVEGADWRYPCKNLTADNNYCEL